MATVYLDRRLFLLSGIASALTPRDFCGAAEMNAREFFTSETQSSLAEAAAHGRVDELASLVEHGADVNAQGSEGMTALYWAMSKSSKTGVGWLLERRADPNVIFTRDGSSAMSLAARQEDPWFLKELLAHGGDANVRNPRNQRTPIFDALVLSRSENVRVLIAAGADLNTFNRLGFTPLVDAAAHQRYESVYDMLVAGADPTIGMRRSGKTILTLIRNSRVTPEAPAYAWQLKVVALLKQKGLDVEHGD